MIPLAYKFAVGASLTELLTLSSSDLVRTPYKSTLSREDRVKRKSRNRRAKLSRQINRRK